MDFDWHLSDHFLPPERRRAPADQRADACQALCFAGPDWQGRPSSCFAWLGLPEHASADEPVPGVVLVHGGWGSAFAEWVRLWTARGYAAIAIDHGGCVPVETGEHEYRRLPDGGPANCGGFSQVHLPPHDRWNYHAVANVMRAHSLLRSLPEVDERRTALTGISWGGYLTSLTAALDTRFRCVVPVYGCAYLDRSPKLGQQFTELTEDECQEWLALWDAQHFLPRIAMPICFINGTIDQHFIPPIWSPSTRLPVGPASRSMQVGLKHSHEHGWAPPEIHAFIAQHCERRPPLPRIGLIQSTANQFSATIAHPEAAQTHLLQMTCDSGRWPERQWTTQPASCDAGRLLAARPENCTGAFLQVQTDDGLRFSSDIWMADAP